MYLCDNLIRPSYKIVISIVLEIRQRYNPFANAHTACTIRFEATTFDVVHLPLYVILDNTKDRLTAKQTYASESFRLPSG